MRVAVWVLLAGGLARADPASALAAAVDLGTPHQRRIAARELAKRRDVSLDQWRAAAAAFGTFSRVPAGPSTVRVPLRVVDRVEETEITVYVPPGYDPAEAAPLLLAFHSTGFNGRSLYLQWRGVADELGMLVLCPSEAGPNKGYAFTERERASTLAALRWARRRYNVDENRVFLAGFNRGGHLAWDLALRRRDRFAALVAMNGAPCMVTSPGANNLRYLDNVLDLPIRAVQGTKGKRFPLLDTVPLVFARLAEQGARDTRLIERDRGRFAAVDWRAFLGGAVREPRPLRVRRAYARRGEGRAFWIEVLAAGNKVKEDFRIVATPGEVKGLDDIEYLQFLQRHADARTARLDVRRTGINRFDATGEHVRKFRLLLDPSMFEPGRDVRITFNGKEFRRRVLPSAAVLLEEFVERFDRTFLPVAALRLP